MEEHRRSQVGKEYYHVAPRGLKRISKNLMTLEKLLSFLFKQLLKLLLSNAPV